MEVLVCPAAGLSSNPGVRTDCKAYPPPWVPPQASGPQCRSARILLPRTYSPTGIKPLL